MRPSTPKALLLLAIAFTVLLLLGVVLSGRGQVYSEKQRILTETRTNQLTTNWTGLILEWQTPPALPDGKPHRIEPGLRYDGVVVWRKAEK